MRVKEAMSESVQAREKNRSADGVGAAPVSHR